MSLAVKGMIRIANEESNCLSSFVILIMPLITMLIKEVPELECRPIVPTIAWKDFLAKIWNPFLKRNCNNRRMKESYATKLRVSLSSLFQTTFRVIFADDKRKAVLIRGLETPFWNAEKSVIWYVFEPETRFCRDNKCKVVLKRLHISDWRHVLYMISALRVKLCNAAAQWQGLPFDSYSR